MKQLIIIAIALIVSATATAQTQIQKPDTIPKWQKPKAVFIPDYSHPFEITLKIPGYVISDYFYVIQNPTYEHGQLTGEQIDQLKHNYITVVDSIYKKYAAILLAQHMKFVSDTTKNKTIK